MPPEWLQRVGAQYGCRPEQAKPHVVEAVMASPVAIDPQHPIMLEGPLQCAAIAMVTGRTPDEVGLVPTVWTDVPIPIADRKHGGKMVAAASSATGEQVEGQRMVRRRPKSERLPLAEVKETLGAFKAWSIPVPTIMAPVLTWHVVADPGRLYALLQEVTSIGRGRQGGLGQVAFWRMRPVKEDRSWVGEDGMPTRPLPVESVAQARKLYGPAVQVAVCGYRAPYWHRAVQTLCALPGGAP